MVLGPSAPDDTSLATCLGAFEAFQSARLDFAQEVARLAVAPDQSGLSKGSTHEVDGVEKVIEALESCDTLAVDIARLVSDLAPSVQQCAMIAMGRLCSLSDPMRVKLTDSKLLGHVVDTIAKCANTGLLKAALFFLHACTKGSAEAAHTVVDDLGVLAFLCERLESSDPSIKADAAWCLGAIARHDSVLGSAVADCGALSLLGLCLKEPSLPLRRVTLACLGCIGQHDAALAQSLRKEGVLEAALPLLKHRDMMLRRHACRMLAVSLQHSDMEIGWFPQDSARDAMSCLGASSAGDTQTATCAAGLVGQLARRSKTLAAVLQEFGVVSPLCALMSKPLAAPVPAATALSYVCDAAPGAALRAKEHGAIASLHALLESRPPAHVCASLCMALGSIAAGDPQGAAAVASSGALQSMVDSTLLPRRKLGAASLKMARVAVTRTFNNCTDYPALVTVLEVLPFPPEQAEKAPATDKPASQPPLSAASAPASEKPAEPPVTATTVHVALLKALGLALAKKGEWRHDFLVRGALTLVQQAKRCGKPMREALKAINKAFPDQMVAATDPDYEKKLLAKLGKDPQAAPQ